MFHLFNEVPSSTSTPRLTGAPPPKLPSVILGDLDSLSPTVRQHYQEKGVDIVDLSADQDSTDLDKCLDHVAKRQAAVRAAEEQQGDHRREHEDLIVVAGGCTTSLSQHSCGLHLCRAILFGFLYVTIVE